MDHSLARSEDEQSIVGRAHLAAIVGYLAFSAACAAPLTLPGTSLGWRIALALLLLGSYLVMARYTVRRFAGLDEFQKQLAWRSLAAAGMVAVWFVLAVSTLSLATGIGSVFTIVALGPPELWLCAALFIRAGERGYRIPPEGPSA